MIFILTCEYRNGCTRGFSRVRTATYKNTEIYIPPNQWNSFTPYVDDQSECGGGKCKTDSVPRRKKRKKNSRIVKRKRATKPTRASRDLLQVERSRFIIRDNTFKPNLKSSNVTIVIFLSSSCRKVDGLRVEDVAIVHLNRLRVIRLRDPASV